MADKYGRKKMYGVELMVIIGGTLGVVMCSTGANNSMDIYAWLIWWRVVVGIGVGADYPLSAIITSEFAPTPKRARMLASVFFMQPLGQTFGNVVSLVVIVASRNANGKDLVRAVDSMWRWVIGIGVIPGVIALAFRIAIPESPRFLLDIEDDPIKAEFDATNLFGEPTADLEFEASPRMDSLGESSSSHFKHFLEDVTPTPTTTNSWNPPPDWTRRQSRPATLNSHWKFSQKDIFQYFWNEGNWRQLAATALCWLLLDFSFYGIGLSNPQFLAKTWGDLHIKGSQPIWKTDDSSSTSIYDMFMHNATEALVILNIGSVVGSSLLIVFANHFNRVSLQKYGFLALAAIFIAVGVMYRTVHITGAVAVTLYVIAQIAFNFGPNGTTYILPAELFPTRYRASCHGISAASGKLGSVLVQIFSTYYKFGSQSLSHEGTERYGTILIVFSAAMVLGAVITHFWIPQVQERKPGEKWYGEKKSRSLEELARGRLGIRSQSATRFAGRRMSSVL
ncbi:MAG: hypothetical protein Q9227_001433 [Pyrenula ochraceoflavens]